jgi:hypothetical protein
MLGWWRPQVVLAFTCQSGWRCRYRSEGCEELWGDLGIDLRLILKRPSFFDYRTHSSSRIAKAISFHPTTFQYRHLTHHEDQFCLRWRPDEIQCLPHGPRRRHSSPARQTREFFTVTPRDRTCKADIADSCESCRRRKVKCSGDQPCQTCSRQGLECRFGVIARRGYSESYVSSPTVWEEGGRGTLATNIWAATCRDCWTRSSGRRSSSD